MSDLPDTGHERLQEWLEELDPSRRDAGQRAEESKAWRQAYETCLEAVRRSQPGGANRQAALEDLARSLNNLGAILGSIGRRAEALRAAQEAADLYRELVATSRDASPLDPAMQRQENARLSPSSEPGDELLSQLPPGQHRNFNALRSARPADSASMGGMADRDAPATKGTPGTVTGPARRPAVGPVRFAGPHIGQDAQAGKTQAYEVDGPTLDFQPSPVARAAADGSSIELGTITLKFLDTEVMWLDLVCIARRGHGYSTLPITLADLPPTENEDEDEDSTDERATLVLHPKGNGGPDAAALRAALDGTGGTSGLAVTPAGLGAFMLLMINLG